MVGFRYFVAGHAERLQLTGWVRNQPDGSVEVVAEGDAGQLSQLEALLRQGPPSAVVDVVDCDYTDETGNHIGFTIAT